MDILQIMPARIKIAAIIRNAILSGEFAAGSELSLTEIASRLGVSRTPVREAFQTLESEGLIALRMNKGAIVKPINEDFITDHFRIRRLLEGEAVYRATIHHMDTKPLEQLHSAVAGRSGIVDDKAYEEYNQSFHTQIWKAADGPKLIAILESLWNGPSYSRAVDDADHRNLSIIEHGQIIQHIAQGEAEQGQQVMHQHIERSMTNILKALASRETTKA